MRFLSSPADICVYGGAAGGGKTFALLLEPLRHIHNPGFGGVIFRRTYPQIRNEGGLWDESTELYPLVGATPLESSLDWRFPSGASIGFRHLQHEQNKLDWQGAQLAFIGFDELTHFSESQFFYMFSRARSTCGVRPYIRATTNPDSGSWVRKFLSPWLDGQAKDGELRYFIRVDGQLVWGRTAEELTEKHPGLTPKSASFVRASVFDNKILLSRDPGYLANLQALPPVEQARLLHGDWNVKREGLVYPAFDSCVIDPEPLPEGRPVGGIDFGFNNPFSGVWGVLDRDDVLRIDGVRYASWTTLPTHSSALPRGVEWWADPARPDSIAELRIAGHDVKPCVHMGAKPILTGIDRVSHRIRTGRLKVSRACADLIREAGIYAYDPTKGKEEPIDADNHAMDALRYLVTGIDRGKAVNGPMPPESDEDREAREKDERERRSAEWHDPGNPQWWGGDDDD